MKHCFDCSWPNVAHCCWCNVLFIRYAQIPGHGPFGVQANMGNRQEEECPLRPTEDTR